MGCVIQKRSARFWLYYRLLSPLRPRRLIVMEWIKGGHGGNWIYCWSDDTKRCKWSWNSVVGKSRNWFGLFWCGWDFFSICCCFCGGGSADDIWGNFAGWWWCIILKYVENLDVGIFWGKCFEACCDIKYKVKNVMYYRNMNSTPKIHACIILSLWWYNYNDFWKCLHLTQSSLLLLFDLQLMVFSHSSNI